MSAHRIKIKPGRQPNEPAASTPSSSITASDIFGRPPGSGDEDDTKYPEYEPNAAEMEAVLKDKHFDARRDGACLPTNGFWKTPDSAPCGTPTVPVAAISTPTAAIPISQSAPGHATGPRTEAGKGVSSLNAIKHGLTRPASCMLFLRGEDSSGYDRLILQFNEQFVPMTGAERECIREIVDSLWLVRRARDLQTFVLDQAGFDPHILALYLRYETAHQRAHNAAIKTLFALQKDRRLRNQNHEEWEEPVIWGALDHFVIDDSESDIPSKVRAAAITSAASASFGSSFRNPSPESPLDHTSAAPYVSQAASNSSSKEVNHAA
jgi:hypothetical protein